MDEARLELEVVSIAISFHIEHSECIIYRYFIQIWWLMVSPSNISYITLHIHSTGAGTGAGTGAETGPEPGTGLGAGVRAVVGAISAI